MKSAILIRICLLIFAGLTTWLVYYCWDGKCDHLLVGSVDVVKVFGLTCLIGFVITTSVTALFGSDSFTRWLFKELMKEIWSG